MYKKRSGLKVRITETDQIFNSIKECADYISASPTCVSRTVNCTHGYVTCQGYHIERLDRSNIDIPRHPPKVRIVESGETYKTIRDCAKAINGSPGAISDILNSKNGRQSHKGYHFERM